MKIKWLIGFVIFPSLFLASCNAHGSITQTPTRTMEAIISDTPKPTATRTSTVAPSPIPTAKQGYTVTPSPTFSPKQETEAGIDTRVAGDIQTQDHFMFIAAPATLEARNVKCKEGFVLEQPYEILRVSNDKWTIFTCSPVPKNEDTKWTPGVDDYGTRYTQITKNDLSQTWIIQHNTLDYSIIDRPDALMTPYRWTADGKYLYLYPDAYPSPDGFAKSAYLGTIISNLYRINLETGDFEHVLQRDQFSALEISPDDQLLVYSRYGEPENIHVKNLKNGNDSQVKLSAEIVAAGRFVWNSDSTKIVFAAAYGKKSEDWQDDISATSIIVLTPKNMHTKTILFKDSRMLIPYDHGCGDEYWVDESTLCLMALSDDYRWWDNFFTINIQSGLVIKISTPTPEFETTSTPTP